ncbi:MOS1T transposase, partial [Pseudoatta argentina]
MDVFKLDQSLSAGLGSAPAPDTLTPEVSFDAGSEFNLSFFDGPEENNSTQGFSDPGSVGSASASPPPGTPASASTGGVNNPNAPPLPIVQVPTTGIVIKQAGCNLLSTITGDRYRLQLMRLSRALKEKRPLYAQRYDKVILLHDNARLHVAKPVKIYLETLKREVLPHPPYSPDIAPSDFHLFRSMAHGLADRRFHSYEEAQKWIDSWIASKDMSFFRRGIHVLPERWEKVKMGKIF